MPFDGDANIVEGEVRCLFRKDPQYKEQKRRGREREALLALDPQYQQRKQRLRELARAAPQLKAQRRRQEASEAAIVLGELETLLDQGKHWIRRRTADGHGNFCMVGGLNFIHEQQGRYSAASWYLDRVINDGSRPVLSIRHFNDTRRHYGQVALVIQSARKRAQEVADELT